MSNRKATSKMTFWQALKRDFTRNKALIVLSLPFIAWYFIFHYAPMFGVVIAFKDYSAGLGVLKSPWVGFKHFQYFFDSVFFVRVLRNTLLLSIYQLVLSFPAPLILALLLNEVKNKHFKKTVQTISYLPHFISLVVVCGMIVNFTQARGLINNIVAFFGGERVNYLLKPEWYRTVYVASTVWRGIGYGSIIYLAALAGIDTELYEATAIDGAGRWKQFLNVTLPGILPTVVIMLILNIGRLMGEGAEKTILLYNPATYETSDIIASFVYRRGLIEASYSFSSAVGLFNSAINLILVISANYISRKINETSLW